MLFIFAITYYFIIRGSHRTSVIVFLMGLIIALGRIIENVKMKHIGFIVDFNTIGLLMGMMILVGLLKSTGFFQYIAIRTVKLGGGNFARTILFLCATVAICSAFLDNVTTILLFSPVFFLISDTLDIDASPLIMLSILSANIGGTATMIGDPPNILIGSASGLSFVSFLGHLSPIAFIAFLITALSFKKYLKAKTRTKDGLQNFLATDPSTVIVDKLLLKKLLIIFGCVLLGFIFHETLDYEMSLIAMTGAAVGLLVSKKSFEEIAQEIEWDTLFFFVGLFMITFALEDVGIISYVTKFIGGIRTEWLLSLALVWIAGLCAAFIGAVPTTVAMIPVVRGLLASGANPVIWWALALGACLGGNGSAIGAAANIVGVSLMNKHTSQKIGFADFFKQAFPLTISYLAVSSAYILFLEFTGW